jgi:hypothetical protein
MFHSGAVGAVKRFLNWFNGLSKKKRVALIVLPILVPLIVVIELSTSPRSGRVLAEEKNLGAFETSESPSSENPFKFDPSHTRRFVITKIEAFGPGVLDHFPPDCGPNTCEANLPDKQPIVLISAEPELRCIGPSEADFDSCGKPLTNQCSLLADVFPEPPTYIWWRRDSAGHRRPQRCAFFDVASDQYVMGFVTDVTPPNRFSLVVQGRDVPIRLKP